MIYFDNAATSRKKPLKVLLSAFKENAFSANAGRGGHKAAVKTALKIERTRDIIREKFFDGNVVFTKNCTEAINLALNGLPLYGQAITTCYDHNSVLRTLKRLEERGKIKLTVLAPIGGSFEKPLRDALKREKTSIVAITGASNVTGKRTNVALLAEIVKKESDAIFLLDAAQTAGHDEMDYKNVDVLCSSGHKGLSGLQGTGFLLFKKNLTIEPLITGGTGTSGHTINIPKEVPEGLEAGTVNASGIISLYYGIQIVFNRREEENERIKRLRKIFISRIKKENNIELYDSDGDIVLLNIKGKQSAETADELSQKGVFVRGGLHCAPLMHRWLGTIERGAVRFSFGKNIGLFKTLFAARILKKIAQKR